MGQICSLRNVKGSSGTPSIRRDELVAAAIARPKEAALGTSLAQERGLLPERLSAGAFGTTCGGRESRRVVARRASENGVECWGARRTYSQIDEAAGVDSQRVPVCLTALANKRPLSAEGLTTATDPHLPDAFIMDHGSFLIPKPQVTGI